MMMRIFAVAIVVLFTCTLALAADNAPAPAPSPAPGMTETKTTTETTQESEIPAVPKFYTRAEALWLSLSAPRKTTLATDGAGNNVFDTGDLHSNWEMGPRVTIGLALKKDCAMEVTYWGLQQWEQSQSAYNPDGFESGWRLHRYSGDGALDEFDRITISNRTEIHNVEVNFRRPLTPFFSGLLGMRYMNIDEQFRMNTFTVWPAPTDNDRGRYMTRVNNNLLGPQIGGDLDLPVFVKTLRFGTLGRAGIMANYVDYQTTLREPGAAGKMKWNDEEVGLAGVFELGANLSWEFIPNWSVRAGYNAFWILGVARAAEQWAPTANDNGTMFLHGPSIGLEGHW